MPSPTQIKNVIITNNYVQILSFLLSLSIYNITNNIRTKHSHHKRYVIKLNSRNEPHTSYKNITTTKELYI